MSTTPFSSEVIEEKPNSGQVLSLGDDGTGVAFQPHADMIGLRSIELQLILRAKFEE
jgi:hypothetical protein